MEDCHGFGTKPPKYMQCITHIYGHYGNRLVWIFIYVRNQVMWISILKNHIDETAIHRGTFRSNISLYPHSKERYLYGYAVIWNTRDAILVLYCRFVAHESVVSQPVTYDFQSQESRPAGSPLVTPNSGHRRCDVLRVADLANGEAANPDSYLISRLESPISSARHERGPAYCKWRATTNARPCCSQNTLVHNVSMKKWKKVNKLFVNRFW